MVVLGFLSVPFWEFGETQHYIARPKKKSKLNYSATDCAIPGFPERI